MLPNSATRKKYSSRRESMVAFSENRITTIAGEHYSDNEPVTRILPHGADRQGSARIERPKDTGNDQSRPRCGSCTRRDASHEPAPAAEPSLDRRCRRFGGPGEGRLSGTALAERFPRNIDGGASAREGDPGLSVLSEFRVAARSGRPRRARHSGTALRASRRRC